MEALTVLLRSFSCFGVGSVIWKYIADFGVILWIVKDKQDAWRALSQA
jgi:hypothetical protein